jgi:2'-5' RNA ligase
MRLFIGVEPDAAARAALAEAQSALRRALGDLEPAFRWVSAANVHITLHFLGTIDAGQWLRLQAALEPPLAVRAFDITTSAAGRFPPRGPIATLWLGIDRGADALARIHGLLADRLIRAGLAVERRPFAAHLTLARARDRDRRRQRRLAWPPAVELPPIGWQATHVTVFRSDVSGPAPVYEAVLRLPLETAN